MHFLRQWCSLSDPAMEEGLHGGALDQEFAQLDAGMTRLPDEITIPRFRHLFEQHRLAALLASLLGLEAISKCSACGFSVQRINMLLNRVKGNSIFSTCGNLNFPTRLVFVVVVSS